MTDLNPASLDNSAVGRAPVRAARPVVLIRARRGEAGESQRAVHLAPLPGDDAGVLTALCGALLRTADTESVAPGAGMPCDGCVSSHLVGSAPAALSPPETPSTGTTPRSAGLLYRGWGWPVLLRGNRLWLSLDRDAVALLVPTPLAAEVAALLAERRCPPPVLAHPYTPDHQVLVAGERYGPVLPWPSDVHRITGTLLLPPSSTARGPLTWIRPPGPHSLGHCREIDVATALRALRSSPGG